MNQFGGTVSGTQAFTPSKYKNAGTNLVPLIPATAQSLQGFGHLVDDFSGSEVSIVTWPQPDWRPVLPGTGNQGGVCSGRFEMSWQGHELSTYNHAVNNGYITGWSLDPNGGADSSAAKERDYIYTFEANYHPDGGQIFFPVERKAFVGLLAKAGDNISPEDSVAFYFDGKQGIHIDPGVWHQPMFPTSDKMSFEDKQGRVHACVACNFVEEFGVYLQVPLRLPANK